MMNMSVPERSVDQSLFDGRTGGDLERGTRSNHPLKLFGTVPCVLRLGRVQLIMATQFPWEAETA
jgi:hypothetical protein